jgi:hypothetical protein
MNTLYYSSFSSASNNFEKYISKMETPFKKQHQPLIIGLMAAVLALLMALYF